MKLEGKVWKLGDNLSVLDLLAAKYDAAGVNDEWDECARHLLEDIDPNFATAVRAGDIILAGQRLGVGHAHYYRATVLACKAAGIAALLGESTNELFQRVAIDFCLPVWSFPGIASLANTGDRVEIDLAAGWAHNLSDDRALTFPPLSPVILEILDAGGSFEWAKRRAAAKARSAPFGPPAAVKTSSPASL